MPKRRLHRPKDRDAGPVDVPQAVDDPVVEEVRRIREAIFATYNYDLKAMGKELIRRTAQSAKAGWRVAAPAKDHAKRRAPRRKAS